MLGRPLSRNQGKACVKLLTRFTIWEIAPGSCTLHVGKVSFLKFFFQMNMKKSIKKQS